MKFWHAALLWVVAALAGWVTGNLGEEPDRIVVLSVGQGDCALVQSEGRSLLIDVGPDRFGAKSDIEAHLERYGVTAVDAILLSHPDADHIGALPAIHRAFPDAPILVPAGFKDDPELTKVFSASGVKQVFWTGSAEGVLGRFQLTIRCPQYTDASHRSDNLGSMFVRVSSGAASYVTSGDAPDSTEQEMVPALNWGAEVLHVGHHGSRFSTSDAWLQAVHPEFAVVSCGINNRYGHPNPETLKRLGSAGIPVYRTDTMGDLELDDRGGRFVKRP